LLRLPFLRYTPRRAEEVFNALTRASF